MKSNKKARCKNLIKTQPTTVVHTSKKQYTRKTKHKADSDK